jgi:hypothetical protein
VTGQARLAVSSVWLMGACAADPRPDYLALSGQWVLDGWVGGDKYGGLTGLSWPSAGTAPLSRGQDKYFACAQHPVGLAGRFELEFQLP